MVSFRVDSKQLPCYEFIPITTDQWRPLFSYLAGNELMRVLIGPITKRMLRCNTQDRAELLQAGLIQMAASLSTPTASEVNKFLNLPLWPPNYLVSSFISNPIQQVRQSFTAYVNSKNVQYSEGIVLEGSPIPEQVSNE